MPLPIPATIATGFNATSGCAYWRDHDQLLLVDSGTGTISALTVHNRAKTVLGTGYSRLTDIVLSADGQHAYVLDQPNLFRVPLSNLNRAAATLVAGGLGIGKTDQIGLDEAHGCVYAVAAPGNLVRITLSTGVISTLATGLGSTRGVLASRDGRYVYVSGDDGRIVRYDLSAGTNGVMAGGLAAPRHMAWADTGESAILFVQNGPPAQVMKLDLTTATPSVTVVAGPAPDSPYSLAVPAPDHILIACLKVVGEVYLTSYSAAGPILLGIGFVPADATHITGGYANTDPGYFFQVRDAPFGGTLPLMINHERARSMGAGFYQVLVGSQAVNQPFSDYLWNATLNRFDLVTQIPVNGFYKLHAAGEIWLNYWLGNLLNTAGLPNGLNTITVKIFGTQSDASLKGQASVALMIDNTVPEVHIDQILHDGSAVKPCDVITSGSKTFTFTITAKAQKHLQGWSLTAYWGDNKSKAVASDDYSHHVSATRIWTGLDHQPVPAAPWDATAAGDPTSTHCAHTFWLSAWDRVINGWNSIHGWPSYQQSITIGL